MHSTWRRLSSPSSSFVPPPHAHNNVLIAVRICSGVGDGSSGRAVFVVDPLPRLDLWDSVFRSASFECVASCCSMVLLATVNGLDQSARFSSRPLGASCKSVQSVAST